METYVIMSFATYTAILGVACFYLYENNNAPNIFFQQLWNNEKATTLHRATFILQMIGVMAIMVSSYLIVTSYFVNTNMMLFFFLGLFLYATGFYNLDEDSISFWLMLLLPTPVIIPTIRRFYFLAPN
jgi:hypothetical protein